MSKVIFNRLTGKEDKVSDLYCAIQMLCNYAYQTGKEDKCPPAIAFDTIVVDNVDMDWARNLVSGVR